MRALWFEDVLRGLRRDHSFTAATLLTLALTLGATTAVFSIVNGVLLEPLPYADPERLVAIEEGWKQITTRVPTLPVNERHFEYWRVPHVFAFSSPSR